MAEAFAAASFRVNRDKRSVDFYTQPAAFSSIYQSGIRSWRTRLRKRYNRLIQITYPNRLPHLGVYASSLYCAEKFLPNHACSQWLMNRQSFISWGVQKCVTWLQLLLPAKWFDSISDKLGMIFIDQSVFRRCAFILMTWFGWSYFLRYMYKVLLTYERFIFENPRSGYSLKTKVWFILLQLFRGDPKTLSAQASLPPLPLPTIHDTCERWLKSVEPIVSPEDYDECIQLSREFRDGIGPKLQRYLHLKRTLSTNWCSDWWEEYVYLTSRSPIMVNSNFYIIASAQVDGYDETELPTTNQAARAANCVHALFEWRYKLDRESLEPQTAAGVRPICMNQFERLFNTTRVPYASRDYITHYEKSSHIVVLHRSRYFKVLCYDDSGRPLSPAEIEDQLVLIMNDTSASQVGEDKIAALTAGSRDKWYNARKDHFYDRVNGGTLQEIETAAFFLVLDDESPDNRLMTQEEGSELSHIAKSLIHGSCSDRWFDKSFCLVVYKNCVIGLNGEHAWADAPVLGMATEWILWRDHRLGYDAAGHARGIRNQSVDNVAPIRLRFQLTRKALKAIQESYDEAKVIADNVDIYVYPFKKFGKNKITKSWKCSPDAFIQISMQLAHVLDKGKHVLTYESAMTRLWRDGRTETVRSATSLACQFVKMLLDENSDKQEALAIFRKASTNHVNMNLQAMVGRGVDRHLFGLYVVCSYLGLESSFLKKAFSMPWGLSTSQTPTNQLSYITSKDKEYSIICPGGGFGPVDPNGYGVSYTVMGDSLLNFHVSSQVSAESTNSKRFAHNIGRAMEMIGAFLDEVTRR